MPKRSTAVASFVSLFHCADDDFTEDEEAETIDINDDGFRGCGVSRIDYMVVDVDDFIEKVEAESRGCPSRSL